MTGRDLEPRRAYVDKDGIVWKMSLFDFPFGMFDIHKNKGVRIVPADIEKSVEEFMEEDFIRFKAQDEIDWNDVDPGEKLLIHYEVSDNHAVFIREFAEMIYGRPYIFQSAKNAKKDGLIEELLQEGTIRTNGRVVYQSRVLRLKELQLEP